jgi:hypothetical protein
VKATGRVAFETPAGVWAWMGPRYGAAEFAPEIIVKIAVKRPAYGCLRCFRLSEDETCAGCGGRCDEILAEPNSVLPKET